MAKKVFTIDVDNKNLEVSTNLKKNCAVKEVEKKEVENFGIVEINNASSKTKVRNKADKGFEKNVVGCASKKSVKAKTNDVEDYFDFSFKKESKVEDVKEEVVSAKAEQKCNTSSNSVLKMEVKDTKHVDKEVVESVKFDSEAYQIIRVARMGSLFDCEKCMINA